jgi:hypothetical protein
MIHEGETLFHEVATMFPPMTDEEFQLLVADIQKHGLQEPLWRYQNQIIDGVHRYRACKLLGIEPRYHEWDGVGSLVHFVVSRNLHRRHLTSTQKAVLALEIEHQLGIEARRNQSLCGGATRALLENFPKALITPLHAAKEAAAAVGTNHHYVTDAKKVVKQAPELKEPMKQGALGMADAKLLAVLPESRRADALQMKTEGRVKTVKAAVLRLKQAEVEAQAQAAPTKPCITLASWEQWLPTQPPCDLLLTDPPYSTEIEDIETFAQIWLPPALAKIKSTGRAYICIGAYPREIRAYLNVQGCLPIQQILVWEYRNTLGPKPAHLYKQNWQAILYFSGPDAPPLDCPLLTEQLSVQQINAPDGRMGDRYHTWQKPDNLAEQLIRHSTRPGDRVYDLFCGTGTFLLAAQRLGRLGFGCDLSQEMVALAEKRGCAIA